MKKACDWRQKLELNLPNRINEVEIQTHWRTHVHKNLQNWISNIIDPKGIMPMRELLQRAINTENFNLTRTRKGDKQSGVPPRTPPGGPKDKRRPEDRKK